MIPAFVWDLDFMNKYPSTLCMCIIFKVFGKTKLSWLSPGILHRFTDQIDQIVDSPQHSLTLEQNTTQLQQIKIKILQSLL